MRRRKEMREIKTIKELLEANLPKKENVAKKEETHEEKIRRERRAELNSLLEKASKNWRELISDPVVKRTLREFVAFSIFHKHYDIYGNQYLKEYLTNRARQEALAQYIVVANESQYCGYVLVVDFHGGMVKILKREQHCNGEYFLSSELYDNPLDEDYFLGKVLYGEIGRTLYGLPFAPLTGMQTLLGTLQCFLNFYKDGWDWRDCMCRMFFQQVARFNEDPMAKLLQDVPEGYDEKRMQEEFKRYNVNSLRELRYATAIVGIDASSG